MHLTWLNWTLAVLGLITVRSAHIRPLFSRIVRFLVFLCWVSESASRKQKTVDLHCSCRMPEESRGEMAKCDSCHILYHHHCMDIPSEVFGESDIHWECKRWDSRIGELGSFRSRIRIIPTPVFTVNPNGSRKCAKAVDSELKLIRTFNAITFKKNEIAM